MKIEEVEGIGPVYSEKLSAAGASTTDEFLKLAGTKSGREKLAEATGISETLIRDWANMVDLMRLNGVGKQFSELLEAAGVDSCAELAQRNAENLAAKLAEVNEAKNLTNRTPSLSEVEKWINEAKTMPKVVSH
jgi:predicted flap endonuclease-1-like 5' DNA nuclease